MKIPWNILQRFTKFFIESLLKFSQNFLKIAFKTFSTFFLPFFPRFLAYSRINKNSTSESQTFTRSARTRATFKVFLGVLRLPFNHFINGVIVNQKYNYWRVYGVLREKLGAMLHFLFNISFCFVMMSAFSKRYDACLQIY